MPLNSSTQNIHKAGEDSFSRSEKEGGSRSPDKEGSQPREENQEAQGEGED